MNFKSMKSRLLSFAKAGHFPTLISAFLYFDVCFAIWVLNGAMAPFISEQFNLKATQKGFMVSVPIISGALMRFPLGILAEYIGRKNAAIVEMSLTSLALLYGWLFVDTYQEVLIMGVLLGIAGASFGVALSLGAGSYPSEYKGLAMGIAGAGNSGTVLATFFGPPLAERFGWRAVYGLAILPMSCTLLILLLLAKEPPHQVKKSLKDYLQILFEKDAWTFNLIYIVTFGGFIGLANFLPTFFHDQFGISKIKAGQFATLVVIMGSAARILGGYFADTFGGVKTLRAVFFVILLGTIFCAFLPNIVLCTLILLFIFASLGTGNGSVFQLVPLRFSSMTTVASSLIGEIGALGGAFIPNAMGFSKQNTGSFTLGFLSFGILTFLAFSILQLRQKNWVNNWIDIDGKALAVEEGRVIMVPAIPVMEMY